MGERSLSLCHTGQGEIRRAVDTERTICQVARQHYPEVVVVTQPTGVGLLTGLRFVLTLEEPGRFRRNRTVGAYLGLTFRK